MPPRAMGYEHSTTETTLNDSKSEQSKEVTWERWQKKRTFVRALEGTYGELEFQALMRRLDRIDPSYRN